MKILIIMAGFFPGKKYGGPPVSIKNFCQLMDDDQCFIVTKNHDSNDMKPYDGIEPKQWIKQENNQIMYLAEKDYCKKTFEQIILELKPDILYLQGLFQGCVLPCLELSKEYSIKVLLAPRGELCKGAFGKKYKKIPYIFYLKSRGLLKDISYQSTSDEETEAIKKYLGATPSCIHFLPNIPSYSNIKSINYKKESQQGKFVFLSRIHPKKNLKSAIEYFEHVEGNAIFDIYGPIEDEEYWDECKKRITLLPTNVQVSYCGLISHDKVHEVFSQYDAFLFPTYSENYGHVIAESLMVGTPVIISDQTPWNEINVNKAGWAIPLDNQHEFIKAIQNVIDWDNQDKIIHVQNVQKFINDYIDIDVIKSEYKDVFNSLNQ